VCGQASPTIARTDLSFVGFPFAMFYRRRLTLKSAEIDAELKDPGQFSVALNG